MKDITGSVVVRGDIMAEETGGGSYGGNSYTSFTIWKANGKKDGSGIQYNTDGTAYEFFWADSSRAYKIDKEKMPKGFLFAFKHGLDSIDVPDEFVSNNIYEMIEKSDWKENAETPESVDSLKKSCSVEINSFSDIARNFDTVFPNGRIPGNVIEKVLELCGFPRSTPVNGEIGIAWINDVDNATPILRQIGQWKKEGILEDKCKELDNIRESINV